MKKNIAVFVLILMLVGMLMPIFGINAYANPEPTTTKSGGAVHDVNVSIKPDGSLEIKGGGFEDSRDKAWSSLITKYRDFITGVSGIGAVTMIGIFILQFLKLGASAGNSRARGEALVGVLWSGVAAAGLGAVAIIVGFFYNAI